MKRHQYLLRFIYIMLMACAMSLISANEIAYNKVITLANTKMAFMNSPYYKENDYYEQGAEFVIYLPPKIPVYRGIFFADGWGTMKRYSPGFAAEVWQFISIQYDAAWQMRSGEKGVKDRKGGTWRRSNLHA